jgi:hypothetical protein
MSPALDQEKMQVEEIDIALHPSNRPSMAQDENAEIAPKSTETGMTKAKWLACIALCLSYTTSYQQNACTSAILKQIDEKLGKFGSNR